MIGPSASRPRRGGRLPPRGGQPPRQDVEDAADAALMQPGPGRDLREREALPLELEQLAMGRGAKVHQHLPQLVGLRDLAGSRLIRRESPRLLIPGKRPLVLDRAAVQPAGIDEVVVRHLGQERPQVVPVGGPPPLLAEAFQEIGPDRLHDVHRVELGAKPRRQPSPHHHAEDRFEGREDLLRGVGLAVGQPLQQGVEDIGVHVSSTPQGSGNPENPARFAPASAPAQSASSSGDRPSNPRATFEAMSAMATAMTSVNRIVGPGERDSSAPRSSNRSRNRSMACSKDVRSNGRKSVSRSDLRGDGTSTRPVAPPTDSVSAVGCIPSLWIPAKGTGSNGRPSSDRLPEIAPARSDDDGPSGLPTKTGPLCWMPAVPSSGALAAAMPIALPSGAPPPAAMPTAAPALMKMATASGEVA